MGKNLQLTDTGSGLTAADDEEGFADPFPFCVPFPTLAFLF
jgi:hypothetical protein